MEQNFIKYIPKEIANLTKLSMLVRLFAFIFPHTSAIIVLMFSGYVSFKQNPLENVAAICNLPQLKSLSVQRALVSLHSSRFILFYIRFILT
jgi:hypothetical protein